MANASNLTTSTDDLSKQIGALKSDLGSITSTLAEMGKAQGSAVAQTAKSQLDAARNVSEAQYAKARDHAVEMTRQADEFVTRQPAVALGIAAGVGFLVGMMSSRK